jgi:uncharacterized protein involved in exopolysaccharide biosynthesis
VLTAFKRRKWWFVVPATAILALAVLLLFVLPPVYRSKATILIESQDIPEALVPALVGDYIDRRLDVLTRRVLLRDNLLQLANRFDLYAEQRRYLTQPELAERMRKDIAVNVLSTEVDDPRTGRTGDITVAFELSFDYPDPDAARRVVDELVSLYLATNQQRRRQVIEETTAFFASERAALERRIVDLEEMLAAFRKENAELLPRQAEFKQVQLGNVEQRLQDLRSGLRALEERQGFLKTQLALTEEFGTLTDLGMPGATPESQLEMARAELATARARYSANHPDVLRLEREVSSLEAVVGARGGVTALVAREAQLAAELGRLQERYTAEHPDVRRVSGQLDSVRASLEEAGGAAAGGASPGTRPRNSAYVQLSAQLNSVAAEIRAVKEQIVELEDARGRLQAQLARAPVVEQEFLQLNRRLETALEERDAVAEKERTAGLSGSLEASAIGEQFVLAEPATVPREPVRPSETLILALGLVLAVGGGGFSLAMVEMLDRSVRSTAHLTQILGDAPLVSIPKLASSREVRRRWTWRIGALVLVATGVVAALVWIDRAVVPLIVVVYEIRNTVEAWLATTVPWLVTAPGR